MPKRAQAVGFLLPAIIVLLLLTVYPTVVCFQLSVMSYQLGESLSEKTFVGLANFKRLFTDYVFWNALAVSLTYTAACVIIEVVLGTAISLLLQKPFRGERIARSLIFMPMMTTPVAVSLVWKSMFNFNYGVINYYLNFVGLNPEWLSTAATSFLAIVVVDVWQWTPFMVLIFITGLASLPVEAFEAALLDGATWWQTVRYVTLPLMKPILTVAVLIRTLDCFKVFDNIYVLTAGGPGRATDVFSLAIYEQNFFYQEVGQAAAMSLVMLVIATVLAQLLVRFMRTRNVNHY